MRHTCGTRDILTAGVLHKQNHWHTFYAAAAAKSLQLCPTLWLHRRQPTRLPVPGILQARTLEWVAISFSNAWKWKVKGKSLSRVWLLMTPWTAAYQAPPSMGFSRQGYWSGVPLPSPYLLWVEHYSRHKKIPGWWKHILTLTMVKPFWSGFYSWDMPSNEKLLRFREQWISF